MIIILSPAKTFRFTDRTYRQLPFFQAEASYLIDRFRQKGVSDIEREMNVSPKIATDVTEYVNSFGTIVQPAIDTFFGAAYKAFDADSLSDDEREYADRHIRILSALYGILNPLDGISRYRLDFKERILGNLYDFWRPKLIEYKKQFLNGHVIVNLASKEFSSVLSDSDMITISFKACQNGKLRQTSMEAKRMRGTFARMMIEERIEDAEKIKQYVIDGYRFDPTHSTEREYVFIKEGEHR